MVQVLSKSRRRGRLLRQTKGKKASKVSDGRAWGFRIGVVFLCVGFCVLVYHVGISFEAVQNFMGGNLQQTSELNITQTSVRIREPTAEDSSINQGQLHSTSTKKNVQQSDIVASATQQELTNPHKNEAISKIDANSPYEYRFAPQELQKIDSPWPNWSKCDPQSAFETVCHPRPATCTAIIDGVVNNHGIGNALLTTYLKEASESLEKQPDCAPIIKDKPVGKQDFKPGQFGFKLLDYVHEPTVVVQPSTKWRDQSSKCITYAITQPREAVSEKVRSIKEKYQQHPETSGKQYPLVAIQLRTGWSDEMRINQPGWDALGTCQDFLEQFPIEMSHHAVSDVALQDMLLDSAAAADRIFGGTQKWRLYVASDAPGIRKYVQHLLQSRVVGPVVWHEGHIGHNYAGARAADYNQKVETSVSAFTDLVIMSEADMLVSLSSKYPAAANLRAGGCPQRYTQFRGHPRHELADLGNVLHDAYRKDPNRPRNIHEQQSPENRWSPSLDDESKQKFFEKIPGGMDNPCTKAADPIRACFCLIKLSHK